MIASIKKDRGLLFAVLCGAIFGLLVAQAFGLAASNGAPDGWSKGEAGVPFRRADLMGELDESSKAWSIDHFQAITSGEPTQELSVTVSIPEGGEVRIFPAATPPPVRPRHGGMHHSTVSRGEPTGAAILLRRSLGGAAYGTLIQDQSEGSLGCSGSLPIPTNTPYQLSITRTSSGFTATAGGETMSCRTESRDLPPAIQSGLQRIHVREIATSSSSQSTPKSMVYFVFFTILGGLLAGCALIMERRLGANKTLCAITLSPLLLAWPLSELNGLALIEQLRAPELSPYTFFLTGPLTITLFLKALHHSVRMSRNTPLKSRKSIGGITLMAGASITWAVLVGSTHVGVVAYTALFGLAIGGLVWVNSNSQSVRFFNGISVALFCTSMVFAETALRFSETGSGWSPLGRMSYDQSLGWVRSTLSDFEALDRGEHTIYPSEGYPVEFQSTNKQRVVCLGSSATGGAFQNDDLDDFYPARLSEVLGDEFDVINQGVGGWTTFHMAQYFATKAAELSPDIVTVYAGHNDLLTKSTAPYRDLYKAWQSDSEPKGPSVLDSVLLYQGLRFIVGAVVNPEGSVAVPLDHARENLILIIDAAEDLESEVILMTEAISPDSGTMVAYANMMVELAESYENTSYVEIPAVVLGRGSSMFLDDVHLTDAGHRAVANEIANHIEVSSNNQR